MGLLATPQEAKSGGTEGLTQSSSADSSELSYRESYLEKGQLHCNAVLTYKALSGFLFKEASFPGPAFLDLFGHTFWTALHLSTQPQAGNS